MIGKLRHRVAIEQEYRNRDRQGGAVTEWTVFADRWAKVEQLSEAARFYAGSDMTDTTHKITIRYTENVTPKMRVRLHKDNRVFYITGIDNLKESNVYMVLRCSATRREKA